MFYKKCMYAYAYTHTHTVNWQQRIYVYIAIASRLVIEMFTLTRFCQLIGYAIQRSDFNAMIFFQKGESPDKIYN